MSKSEDRLIETAQALLWERGYVGMSPRAIQDRAGVGQGSMYHHFRSKAALAKAAEERTAAELIAQIERLFNQPGDPLDHVVAFLRFERDVLKGCRIGGLVADPEVFANEELRRPLQETFEWMTERIASLLKEAQKLGRLSPEVDTEVLAVTILAVRQGGYVLSRAANSAQSYSKAVEGLISLITSQASAGHRKR